MINSAPLHRQAGWLALVIALVLIPFTVSTGSFDMDEAQTWDYASKLTFGDYVAELRADPNSEAQMPLGMFCAWAWARGFGTSEMAMRSLNVLWAGCAVAALAFAGRRLRLPWLPVLLVVQPFFWFYMGQARPYMMQIAGGALMVAGYCSVLREDRLRLAGVAAAGAGALILCGASMLGAIPAGAALGALALVCLRRKLKPTPLAAISAVVILGILGVLGVYYVTTLARGAGGAKSWGVSPANMIFAMYEFFGLQGLGAGRQQLREMLLGQGPKSALLAYAALPAAGALVYAVVAAYVAAGWKRAESSAYKTVVIAGLSIVLMSVLVLFSLALVARFPFWGRHLAGAFPWWTMALGAAIKVAAETSRPARLWVGVMGGLLVFSSLSLRFSPRHENDDYRGAAKYAREAAAKGWTVWWFADRSGGSYYGVGYGEGKSGVVFATNREDEGEPDVIILSRPENFDRGQAAQRLIGSARFHKVESLQSFLIYERNP